ncbi:Rab-like protein 2A [Thoreauomyces humboldtii]|nr:Rab-like protein 2A [Thoreauomyces humboldtii]
MGRKVTYKNLDTWYDELVGHRGTQEEKTLSLTLSTVYLCNNDDDEQLPVIVVANKIDVDASRARKSFGFVDRRRAERAEAANQTTTSDASEMDHLPLFFSSASDGTNVVSIFREAINRGMAFKKGGESGTFVDEVLAFIREEEGKGEGGMFKKEVAAEEDKSEAKETREASGTAEVTGAPSPSSGLPASRSNIAAA